MKNISKIALTLTLIIIAGIVIPKRLLENKDTVSLKLFTKRVRRGKTRHTPKILAEKRGWKISQERSGRALMVAVHGNCFLRESIRTKTVWQL